jgi:hypothetical protein
MRILPDVVARELEERGFPWEIKRGHGSAKLFVAGRLAGVLPWRGTEGDRRASLNIRAQIRRIADEAPSRKDDITCAS